MPLLPQEGFRELHTQTLNSMVVRLLSWVAQDPGPNSPCVIQDGAGTNTFLRKVVPACLGYLNIHGTKERRLCGTADKVRYSSDCWAPASSAEPQAKWISPWGWLALLGQAGHYSLLAGERSGSHVLVGREVLQSLGEFSTNWAIN